MPLHRLRSIALLKFSQTDPTTSPVIPTKMLRSYRTPVNPQVALTKKSNEEQELCTDRILVQGSKNRFVSRRSIRFPEFESLVLKAHNPRLFAEMDFCICNRKWKWHIFVEVVKFVAPDRCFRQPSHFA